MAQINLAPETRYAAAARRRQRLMYVLAAIVAAAALAAWAALALLARQAEAALQAEVSQIAVLDTELARLAPDVDRIALFEGRLTVLDALLDQHVVWTPLWQELEKLLPPPTVLRRLSVDQATKRVEITATAPNLDEVAQTLASLTSEGQHVTPFASATMSTASREVTRDAAGAVVSAVYRFAAELTLL